MKFDIVRAWKDEVYRQSLSKKQRNRLPANPVGELTEAEMERVVGGDGGGGGGMQPAAPTVIHHHTSFHRSTTVATGTAANSVSHTHSYSVLCDINVFSLERIKVINIDDLFNIANVSKQVCINGD